MYSASFAFMYLLESKAFVVQLHAYYTLVSVKYASFQYSHCFSIVALMASSAPCRFSVAIMVDTEGSEVHTSELDTPLKAEVHPHSQ
jgi:hypothetical protein